MAEEGENRKRKAGKKGSNVPLSELGFKAKVYYGIETEYTRRRVKYKAARYGAENSKQCFMGRLTFIVDPNQLTQQQLESLNNFKGISKHEWERVKQVIYHSRDQLKCAICLQNNFKAPQMTHCGHVFCWNCIYMHHFKSLKANSCPVCNEFFTIDSIVSCKPIYARQFQEIEQNKIKLALKYKPEGGKKIYNCDDLVEDYQFARLIKATTEKVVEIYEAEKAELTHFYSICDDEEVRKWLQKILTEAECKIQRSKVHYSKRQYRLHKNQRRINGYILSYLQQKSNLINFYQQHSGKFVFLHPICDKFLRSSKKQLLPLLQQQILKWQQIQYNTQMIKKYKQLHHITINQQIDLVIIDLKNLISEEDNKQYHVQLEQYNIRKKEENQREERECQRLQVKYQKQKQYMSQLKKMEESEFFDIKLPTTLDPTQIDNNQYFPSLIQTKSMPESPIIYNVPSPKQKNKKKQPKKLHDGDFPQLFKFQKQPSAVSQIQQATPILNIIKSQQPKPASPFPEQKQQFPSIQYQKQKKQQQPSSIKASKKSNRKKKEKFINVTDQFFQSRQDQDY